MTADHGPRRAFDLTQTLDGHIAAQVTRAPDATALTGDHASISYAEMWRRVVAWTAELRRHGVGVGDVVGVCADRCIDLPVVLLAVMRCGAAYCPLEPDQPAARLSQLTRQARPTATVTAPAFAELVQHTPDHGAVITAGESNLLGTPPDQTPGWQESAAAPERPAYVIFTSGSTGRPKGVMVPHRAVVNRLLWMQETFSLTADDVVLQKTPYGFDVSVWELFWPLLAGARLHMLEPDGHRDPGLLAERIRQERVTTVHFVPSMLRLFLEEPAVGDCRTLKRVICSGEALGPQLMHEALEILSPASLYNLYGPTEATIDVTYWRCREQPPHQAVPIGEPVANVDCYVLGSPGGQAPDAAEGELCIGGVQVALGYINAPTLTADRFVHIPGVHGVLYRTGDLVRRRDDGLFDYLGRVDRQIKLNGVRIEPGEIETVTCELPEVRAAAVIPWQASSTVIKLVAYVVLREPTVDERTIRRWLAARLPQPMVPAHIMLVASLPVTRNGKLDTRALPAPSPPAHARRSSQVATDTASGS